jgi:hypothetical protein
MINISAKDNELYDDCLTEEEYLNNIKNGINRK